MNCPKCNRWTKPTEQDRCPNCGLDRATAQAIYDMRQSINGATNRSDELAHHIAELRRSQSALEQRILDGLASPPRATSDQRPERPDEIAQPPAPPQKNETAPPVDTTSPSPLIPFAEPANTAPSVASRASAATSSDDFEMRFGQTGLLIVGIIVTLFSVGYFLKYSFDQNWIGPAGRVALAYGASFGAILFGEVMRRRDFRTFGLNVFGGGIGGLYFATYAGLQIYALFSQELAFTLMAAITAATALFSVRFDVLWLAVLACVGGFLTPILLRTGVDNQTALMTYLTILNFGILTIAAYRLWPLLNRVGVTATWLVFSAWFAAHYAPSKFLPTLIFLNIFFLTYALVPFIFFLVRASREHVVGHVAAVINSFVAFGYNAAIINELYAREFVALPCVAYAIVFSGLAVFLRRRFPRNEDAFALLCAVSFSYLALAGAIYFSGETVTLFWAIQAACGFWYARKLCNPNLQVGAAAVAIFAAGKLLTYDMVQTFDLDIEDLRYAAGYLAGAASRIAAEAVVVASLAIIARLARRSEGEQDALHGLPTVFRSAAVGSLFVLLTVETAAAFGEFVPAARLASISVLWALFASALIVAGFRYDSEIVRKVSIGLFAVTVLKIFLFDTARVETPYRILSFLAVGLLLVGASYLYHRFAKRLLVGMRGESG